MSTKEFFNKSKAFISNTNDKASYDLVESSRNVNSTREKETQYIPHVDFSDAGNFCFYGSAELYYKSAISRIYDFYPYDGSSDEKNKFFTNSFDIDKYFFDNLYPKTNGYVRLSGSYITIKGGPNTIASSNTKGLFGKDGSQNKTLSNIYSEDIYTFEGLESDFGNGTRESNLKTDLSKGVTVEFWLKSDSLASNQLQTIFHLTNSAGGNEFSLYLTGTTGSPFRLTLNSGSTTNSKVTIGSTPTTTSIQSFKHYAVTVLSDSDGNVAAKFYVNGAYDSTTPLSSPLGAFREDGLLGYIGSGSEGALLSASVDEFRFWKVERSAEEIGLNWFAPVDGGTNSDIANTTLGVYYKFNEGKTGTQSQDQIVLDYSGRLTNGVFTGYSTEYTRVTSSALVESGLVASEEKDPIIYSNHPDVVSLYDDYVNRGKVFDYGNNTSFINYLPSWVIEEHEDLENKNLKYISHIVGSYFDFLFLRINDIENIKTNVYPGDAEKPVTYAQALPASLGLDTPDLFVDADILETIKSRNKDKLFADKLENTKNLIYSNLYSNLAKIYKSKGTKSSIRNTLRALGVPENIVTFTAYTNNVIFDLESKRTQQTVNKKFVNFNSANNSEAVLYISGSGISGSGESGYEDNYGVSYETELFFPYFDTRIRTFDRNFTTSSIMGVVHASSPPKTTIGDTSFFIAFEKNSEKSRSGKFTLRGAGSASSIVLTSSNFVDVYDNKNWLVSLRVKPNGFPANLHVTGGTKTPYTIQFTGYQVELDTIVDSFDLTTATSAAYLTGFLTSSKQVFVGARRDNITGSTVSQKADYLVSSVRGWNKYISNNDLISHARDFENVGVEDYFDNINPIDPNVLNVKNKDTLAFNWMLNDISTSDGSGEFVSTDASSGSSPVNSKLALASYGAHDCQAKYFPVSSTSILSHKKINVMNQVDLGSSISDDQVKILSSDDELFEAKDIIPNYHYFLEKSLYKSISAEMMNFFSGIIDFNNVIGQYQNTFRMEYKELSKLREIFFEKVTTVTEVEKFINYYKWFDDAISSIVSQLLPASSDFTPDLINTIEPHALERDKYQHRLPMLEFTSSTEGVAFGAEELRYNWRVGHAPFHSNPTRAATATIVISDSGGISHADTFVLVDTDGLSTTYIINGGVVPASGGGSGGSATVGFSGVGGGTAGKIAAAAAIAIAINATTDAKYTAVSNGVDTVTITQTIHGSRGNKTNTDSIGSTVVSSFTNGFDGDHATNALWWKTRAERTGVLNSGDSKLDTARQAVNRIIVNNNNRDAPRSVKADRTIYRPSPFKYRTISKNVVLDKNISREIKGGVNFEHNKNIHFTYAALHPAGPVNLDDGLFVPRNVLLGKTEDLVALQDIDDRPEDPAKKVKRNILVQHGRDWEGGTGYKNAKSSFAFPFNIISSSVKTGYNAEVLSRVTASIEVTNLHNDVYGPDMEKPLQGPFTEYAVGGHQSRHIKLNKGSDTYLTRPEAWKLALGLCEGVTGAIGMLGADYPHPEGNAVGVTPYPLTGAQKAVFFRDELAKRPVNIRNIKHTSGSTILGNYNKNYEVVSTVGGYSNPRAFIEEQPAIPAKALGADVVKTILDDQRGQKSHFTFIDDYGVGYLTGSASHKNKTVIVSRFSAPGSRESMSPAFKDFRSGDFSVYNTIPYRNMTVRRPFQGVTSSIVSEATGIRSFDHTGKDFGLANLAARHATRFFRDSTIVADVEHPNVPRNSFTPNPAAPGGTHDAFVQAPSFHKTHRNNALRVKKVVTVSTTVTGALNNASGSKLPRVNNENFFIGKIGGSHADTYQTERSGALDTMRTNGFAFSCWFKIEAVSGGDNRYFYSHGKTNSNRPLISIFEISQSGPPDSKRIRVSVDTTSGSSAPYGTSNLVDFQTNEILQTLTGSYHHLLVTISGSNGSLDSTLQTKIYVDGVSQTVTKIGTAQKNYAPHNEQETSINGFSGLNARSAALIGAKLGTGTMNFSGSLDEMTLWSRYIEPGQVADIYNAGKPCDITGSTLYTSNTGSLVGWWRMGDSAGDSAALNNPGLHLAGNKIVNVVNSNLDLTPLAGQGSNNNTTFVTDVVSGCVGTIIGTETEGIACRQLYDNLNISHQIPRSDRQYSWFAHSITHTGACEPRYSGFMLTDSPVAPYYEITGNYYPFFDYVTASAPTASFYQNTTRLDLLVHDKTGSERNTLGEPTISASFVSGLEQGRRLNALLIHRGDTYGWNWRALHQKDHPILNRESKKRIITVQKGSELKEFRLPPVSLKGRVGIANLDSGQQNVSIEITNNNEKIYFNERELNDLQYPVKDPTLTELDQVIDVGQQDGNNLNWLLHTENVFPSTRNEGVSGSRERLNFDNGFWRGTNAERVALGSTGSSVSGKGFNSVKASHSQSSWPLEEPSNFLTRTSALTVNASIVVNHIGKSSSAGELQNEYVMAPSNPSTHNFFKLQRSIGSLYARKQFMTSPNSVVSRTGFAQTASLTDSFTHKIKQFGGEAAWEADDNAVIQIKSGSSFVTSSSPSKPWFNNYDDYKEELMLMARGYSIVPEFRISEHVNDYYTAGFFNKTKQDELQIVGTVIDSDDAGFYKDYSNSDFLREFSEIKDKSQLTGSEIMLSCKAAIRFNPYKGFYPAQRTLDLVSQFSKSYGKGIAQIYTSGSISTTTQFNPTTAPGIRPIVQPLFAPGILYNSIKSGLAVDYPIINIETKFVGANFNNSVSNTENYCLIPSYSGSLAFNARGRYNPNNGQIWDFRVPFEAIIEPGKFIDKTQFIDMEPNPSASVQSFTASLDASTSDEVYSLMAKNFFGQTGEFFLKDRQFTKIKSDLIQDGIKFSAGEVYGARLKIRRSHNGARFYNKEYDYSGKTGSASFFSNLGAKATDGVHDGAPLTLLSGTYPLPQDPAHNDDFEETFTMYSRTTAFGPDISGRSAVSSSAFLSGTLDSIEGFNWAYTPPYYHGESWVDFVFRPAADKEYTLEDILSETETVFWRADAGEPTGSIEPGNNGDWKNNRILIQTQKQQSIPSGFGIRVPIFGGSVINDNAMQISSSINLFGVERVPKIRKDKFGNTILNQNELAGKRWVIQPKWETPMLNFANVTSGSGGVTYPTNFSESVPRGIWHQFGEIPNDPSTGVFLEIEDISQDWLKNHYQVVKYSSSYNNNEPATSGSTAYKDFKSLTDLFGFNRSEKKSSGKVRLGEIADKREMYEAVVAIPYIIEAKDSYTSVSSSDDVNRKKFIGISKERFNASLKEQEGSATGDSLDVAGQSIREMVQKMKRYVLPPQFDFINFSELDPFVMYFFEFKYELDRDDLSYIWQNLAPRDYKKITFQESRNTHKLMDNELLDEPDIMNNENLRWMVFKVKQKAKSDYYDLIPTQNNAARQLSDLDKGDTDKDDEYLRFNWPYDYVSFVELINLDVSVLYKNEE